LHEFGRHSTSIEEIATMYDAIDFVGHGSVENQFEVGEKVVASAAAFQPWTNWQVEAEVGVSQDEDANRQPGLGRTGGRADRRPAPTPRTYAAYAAHAAHAAIFICIRPGSRIRSPHALVTADSGNSPCSPRDSLDSRREGTLDAPVHEGSNSRFRSTIRGFGRQTA
jgi:hypothetical protein